MMMSCWQSGTAKNDENDGILLFVHSEIASNWTGVVCDHEKFTFAATGDEDLWAEWRNGRLWVIP